MKNSKGDFPQNWKWVALKDVGIIVTGNTPSKKISEYYGNEIPFYKPSDLEQGINTINAKEHLSLQAKDIARVVPANSTLVTCIGSTIGKVGMTRKEGALNQQLNAIIPFINPKYLYYYTISDTFTQQLLSKSSATTIPIINKSKFETIQFPLAPLKDQIKIVEKIEQLFEELNKIDILFDKVQYSIESYWFAELNSFFKGDKESKIEKVSTENFYFKELPKSWKLIKLSDAYSDATDSISDGPFGSNLKSSDFIEDGVPVIKIQNIDRNKFLNKDISFISEKKFQSLKKHQFLNGDIIVTKLGSPLGKSCIIPKNFPKGVFVADLIRIKQHENINTRFIMYSINSPYIINQLESLSKGTTRQRITLKNFRNLKFILPSKSKQDFISERISTLEEELNFLRQTCEKARIDVKKIKNKILENAFSGVLISSFSKDSIIEYLDTIKKEKNEYLKNIEVNQKVKKINSIPTKNMDLLEILKEHETPMTSYNLWQASKHKKNIEEFYKELKKVESKIREIKDGHISYIELIK